MKTWVKMQGAIREDDDKNTIHLQGSGYEVNRKYGFAGEVTLPNDFITRAGKFKVTSKSLAGTSRMYFPVGARIEKDKIVLGMGSRYRNIVTITKKGNSELIEFINKNQE